MLPSEYVKRGWCQDSLKDENGNVCVNGALWEYEYEKNNYKAKTLEAISYFHTIALKILGKPVSENPITNSFTIIKWNNDPERTQEEVVDLLEKVEQELGLWNEMPEFKVRENVRVR